MKYDERIKILKEKVIKFLEDYEIPTSFDKARAQKEMKFMCEDLNRKIPSDYKKEQVDSLMNAISQYCRENMSNRSWPTIKLMIKGLETSLELSSYKSETRINNDPLDSYAINAHRIKNGEPVSEMYLSGNQKLRVMNTGIVSYSDFEKYDKWLAKKKEKGYV